MDVTQFYRPVLPSLRSFASPRNDGAVATPTMLRFSANLSFLFNEVPFLERFAEAAHAGFRAVEFAFPYEYQAKELASRIQAHKLDVVLFNTPPGDWEAGDRGLASLPGREHEFAASVSTALRYAQALKCSRLHVMAGVLPHGADADERARRLRIYVRNLKHRVRGGGGAERHDADRADQSARHAELPAVDAEPRRTRSARRWACPTCACRWTSITRRSSRAT